MRSKKRRPTLNHDIVANTDEWGIIGDDAFLAKSSPQFLRPKHQPMADFNILDAVTHIFTTLGIRQDSSFFSIDTTRYNHMVHGIGDPKRYKPLNDKNKINIITLLELGIKINVQRNQIGTIIGINGFSPSNDGFWEDNTEGAIKIKDHVIGEPLVCPICDIEYYDSRDMLLAQTVSYHKVSVILENSGNKNANVMMPHIVLTPICPNCYCSRALSHATDASTFEDVNKSPVFAIPDENRQMVPLLPKCIVERIDNEHNVNIETNPTLYWPNMDIDIICHNVIMDGRMDDNQEKQ